MQKATTILTRSGPFMKSKEYGLLPSPGLGIFPHCPWEMGEQLILKFV